MVEHLPPEVDSKMKDPRVRQMVLDLIDSEMTPQDIAAAMDGRVSARTIYRWAKNETYPQNERDLKELQELHARKFSK